MKTEKWIRSLVALGVLVVSGVGVCWASSSERTSARADLCDVLRTPSKYAGKTITVVARISLTKEGGFLWSPGCSKRRVRLIIDLKDESGTAGGFLAALRRHGLSDHPIIATLTGIYVPDYYDDTRNLRYPVFRVTGVAQVTRSRDVERP